MSRTAHDYVGPYRLLNLIRTGKTCQVVEAIDDRVGQRCAIKMLLAEFRNDRAEVNFLKHEYEVGRQLDHPRVIKAYGFGIEAGTVYLAMELFAAPNVKQLIYQGVEQLAPVLPRLIEQAAEGLSYFHSQGWVHRDVKPDNFLMKQGGGVKLIDFALAKKPARGLAKLFRGSSSKIQGTRSYMSPEQIRGQILDQRADIYSFGCMVHELLAGRAPFTGANTNELLTKHLKNAPPPLQAANRNVTDEFANLVRRTLAKQPEGRPQTMEDVLKELASIRVYKNPPPPVGK